MKRVLTTLALVVLSTPALAHVTLERAESAPGASYRAVLRVPHGCAGSATTKITVQVPEGMIAVKPMPKPGWTLTVKKGPYEKTYDFMHGIKMSAGVREIAWTGRLDEFVFAGFVASSLQPGATLAFPTVQECEKGTERWVDVAADGQDPHALKAPAPLVRLAQASGGGHEGHAAHAAAAATSGNISIEAPWLRATPSGAKVAGGYMKITNNGKEPDRLVGGTIEGTGRFEVHEMSMVDNVMRMRELANGLTIKPGETVELKPGGYHIMGLDLKNGFKAGQTVKGTLVFEKAGSIPVEYSVAPIGAGAAPAGGHSHH